VTRPYHPLFGQAFELVTYRKAWGQDRGDFRDQAGRLHHMPAGWTSARQPDPFTALAGGRCRFRPVDRR